MATATYPWLDVPAGAVLVPVAPDADNWRRATSQSLVVPLLRSSCAVIPVGTVNTADPEKVSDRYAVNSRSVAVAAVTDGAIHVVLDAEVAVPAGVPKVAEPANTM